MPLGVLTFQRETYGFRAPKDTYKLIIYALTGRATNTTDATSTVRGSQCR